MKAAAPFQRAVAPSIGKSANGRGINRLRRSEAAGSTAGHAHMPVNARSVVPAIDDEVVAFRLRSDGAVDGRGQKSVIGGGTQGFAQIRGVLMPEAGVKGSGAGDAHAVARLAEIMRHRRDEAEFAGGLLDADIARGPARRLVEIGEGVV